MNAQPYKYSVLASVYVLTSSNHLRNGVHEKSSLFQYHTLILVHMLAGIWYIAHRLVYGNRYGFSFKTHHFELYGHTFGIAEMQGNFRMHPECASHTSQMRPAHFPDTSCMHSGHI